MLVSNIREGNEKTEYKTIKLNDTLKNSSTTVPNGDSPVEYTADLTDNSSIESTTAMIYGNFTGNLSTHSNANIILPILLTIIVLIIIALISIWFSHYRKYSWDAMFKAHLEKKPDDTYELKEFEA